jgi:hypothetical protein
MRLSVGRWTHLRAITGRITAAALLLGGCSGDGSPTEQLTGAIAHIDSPNGAEGAAIVEFAGSVREIVVVGGTSYVRAVGGVSRAAIVLDKPGTIRFSLPDFEPSAAPTATVLEVAAGDNALRANVAAYRVTYER